MSKLSKNIGLFGAFILLFLDILAIYGCFGSVGSELFSKIIDNMLPCGLLLGTFAFCVLLDKPAKKAIGIISVVVFTIAAALRLIIGALFIAQLNSEGVTPLSTEETILSSVEVFAFIPLIISAAFLVVYALKAKMKKATQIAGGISIIALLCVWAARLYQLVSAAMSSGLGMVEIYMNIFETGLVWDILLIGGYAFVLSSLTGALEKKE